MKQIFNEGRIIGLSQYELYVRQLKSMNPEATPLTERQWLIANASENCSMILRVPSGTTAGKHDFYLPTGTDLCGCTMLHAYMFEGEVTLDSTGNWATGVSSYGKLISNTADSHPVTPGGISSVPTMPNPHIMSPELKERCKNYLKISSGLLIQPGTWTTGVQDVPALTESGRHLLAEDTRQLLMPIPGSGSSYVLEPNFDREAFVRIAVAEPLTADVYILIHGFMHKYWMISGASSLLSASYGNPQDGDFLGPALFPWACPIMFTVTTNIIETTNNGVIISLVQ